MESSFSVLWLISTDCSTDLKARAAVAPTHARKPMRWNDGSPPLATTIPAVECQLHAATLQTCAPSNSVT